MAAFGGLGAFGTRAGMSSERRGTASPNRLARPIAALRLSAVSNLALSASAAAAKDMPRAINSCSAEVCSGAQLSVCID
jgi:hypothetical protein